MIKSAVKTGGNIYLLRFLRDYAVAAGLKVDPVAEKEIKEGTSTWTTIGFIEGGKVTLWSNRAKDATTDISVESFLAFCDDYKKKPPVKLQLTPSYEAVVDKQNQVVTVGCQTIPFAKVKELAALLDDKA